LIWISQYIEKKEISYEELEKELENLIKVYGGDI